MKKALVIITLSMVTIAQAALSLSLSATTVSVGSNMTLNVSSDSADMWSGYLVLSEDIVGWAAPVAAAWDDHIITSGIGDQGYIRWESGYENIVYFLNVAGTSVLPVAGDQFKINIKGVAAGRIYIALQDPSTYENIVPPLMLGWPEPATICLFAFGGLFLRRRK